MPTLNDDGKNVLNVTCPRCCSIVLCSKVADFSERKQNLPIIAPKSELKAITLDNMQSEENSNFWMVDDMYKFENIGFCNQIGTIKYLICADCEVGPIGFHDTAEKPAMYYISVERVVERSDEDSKPMQVLSSDHPLASQIDQAMAKEKVV